MADAPHERKQATMKNQKFNMITAAQKRNVKLNRIVENVKVVAAMDNKDPIRLLEDATHVVAGIKQLMSDGQPLTSMGLSPQNLANVVSGLRALTSALPKITDPQKQTRALKILGGLTLGQNMSTNIVGILGQFASKDPQHAEIQNMFQQYAQSQQPAPELVKILGQLQLQIDQVAQAASQQPPAQATPAAPAPAPA